MSLSIRLNGTAYSGFTVAHVDRNFEELVSSFTFNTTASLDWLIPFREGDLIEIITGDLLLLTGYVDQIAIQYGADSHHITIKGRSKTQDIVDGMPMLDTQMAKTRVFETGTFAQLCKTTLKGFPLEVIDEANNLSNTPATRAIGETCFDFLERIAKKNQSILTDDPKGNLVITQASKSVSTFKLKSKARSNKNNIKSASRDLNVSEIHYAYVCRSSLDGKLNQQSKPKDLSNNKGEDFNNFIRKSRVFEIFVKEASDSKTLEQQAIWEKSIRLSRNFKYTCVVQGHTFLGSLLEPNMFYQIDDDFCNVHGQFFCNQIEYDYSLDNGTTSTMHFTYEGAYTTEDTDAGKTLYEEVLKTDVERQLN